MQCSSPLLSPRFLHPRRKAPLLIGSLLLATCGAPQVDSPPSPETAATLPSSAAELPRPAGDEGERYLGVLQARRIVEISSEIEGGLETVEVAVGDEVERDQRLASIDTTEHEQDLTMARASLRATEAAVARARVELDKTRKDLARRQRVRDVFSEEEVATLEAAEAAAAATLETQKARLAYESARIEQLQSHIESSVLRAPFAGRVALYYIEPGELVRPGMAVIRLIGEGFLVRFAVPPEEIDAVRLGQPVEVRFDALDLRVGGVVTQIAPQIDLASQMLFVEAELELTEAQLGRLQDGLVGRVAMLG